MKIQEGTRVRFMMPVEGVDEGIVMNVDGEYVMIEVQLENEVIELERFLDEISKVFK